jgi:F5/8 type C domain
MRGVKKERIAAGGAPSLRDGGPLPRPPFCSFLATAVDPSPNPGGGVGGGRVSLVPRTPRGNEVLPLSPRNEAGGGRGVGAPRRRTAPAMVHKFAVLPLSPRNEGGGASLGERRERPRGFCLIGLVLALAACTPMQPASTASALTQAVVLDDFESVDAWSAHPSEGVELRISQDSGFAGRAMRLDFDFRGGTGYAIARRALPIDLPADWEFAFRVRADAPVNDLELKLIDPSGENVWWMNRRRFEYPRDWQRIRTQKRQVEFAWGPKGGGEMDSVAQLEIVVTAGTGGKGTVWIDDLTFRERPPAPRDTLAPSVRATGTDAGSDPALALDGDTTTAWRAGRGRATLSLDFLRAREMGGAVLHWDSAAFAADYVVEASDDGARWEPVYTVTGGDGGRDPLYLPETETRHLRLRLPVSKTGGAALREIEIMPAEWSQTPNAFFANLAKEAPRGAYPRYLAGEQSYWTVVGVSGDTRESTINTDGMVETGIGMPSIEPFVYAEGRLLSWADVRSTQSLADGYLPIPSVEWDAQPLRLTVTAFPGGEREASTVYVRYRVENRAPRGMDATLYLALRPFQVNPPWQFLNVQGGVARVREIAFDDTTLVVNGAPALVAIGDLHRFGAAPFDAGDIVDYLRRGRLPEAKRVTDPRGFASAALAYPLRIPAGESREVLIGIPLHGAASPVGLGYYNTACEASELHRQATVRWEAELNRFSLRLPAAMHGEEIANTLRSQLAYILINRDGPSIQPGSRSYDRSWIRDGSLTSAALLRLGHADEVRAFAEWYAPHQRASGYVPCCVSLRGADPVPEHDSHGQLIYLFAEYHRQTGDAEFLGRMWPHVERAVAFIDTLRRERMTPEYQAPEKRAYFGMVPQSISHEGYSARPMHSYWDDFFVMKGLDDAVYVADVLGRTAERARFARIRDEFRGHLLQSLRLAMQMHRIDYLPGSVELGDFDATSTTVGVNPMGGLEYLPRGALEATFERYYRESIRARLDGAPWDGYTPYEWRTVGTFVRLGWKARAHEAIDLFFGHRRPAAWNQWAEVVFRDETSPRFIGDMPHTWVGSDFIRSVLDLFAYERTADSALVVGVGIPAAWVNEAPGVEMDGLRTWYGPLTLRMRADGSTVRARITGPGLRVPPGGIVLRTPLDRPIRRATVNGRAVSVGADAREIVVRAAPADVVLEH